MTEAKPAGEPPPAPKSGLPPWAKTIGTLIFGLIGAGGAAGGVSFLKTDKNIESVEARFAVLESSEKRNENQQIVFLAKLDTIVSRIDGINPALDEMRRRDREQADAIRQNLDDNREARRDLKADLNERIDDFGRRLEALERRFARGTAGPFAGPGTAGPGIMGDASPGPPPELKPDDATRGR